jgi:glycosyltransferase involved in cell wall biosynthesis
VPTLLDKFDRAVRDSAMVLVGSKVLADWCLPRNPNTHVVWTSNPHTPPSPVPHTQRLPVVCWAQNGWDKYVEEGDAVRAIILDMHRRLGSKPGAFDFRIIGVTDPAPWERFVAPLKAAGVTCSFRGYLPYDHFLAELSQVAVGLHVLIDTHIYSRAKSFGKLLSYSTAGVAIVATNNLETPRAFTDNLNARLCDTHEQVAQAACDLLQNPAQRQQLGDAAQRLMEEKFASKVIAQQVSSLLRTLLRPKNTQPDRQGGL